jgi:hypothetical protein
MPSATFRFYEELNDYLPESLRKRDRDFFFDKETTVGAAIEAFGITLKAVELILVGSESVDFSCIVANGDRVAVYPVFESLNVKPILRVRKRTLRKTRLAADADLGPLAEALRSRGADVSFSPSMSRQELSEIARSEKRILLTRDGAWIDAEGFTHAMVVREGDVGREAKRILTRLDWEGEGGSHGSTSSGPAA